MTRTQISTSVSERTRQQADALIDRFGYSLHDVVSIAIDRMHTQEVATMNAREFDGHNQAIVGGSFTEEELAAARAVGSINAFHEGLFEVLDDRSQALPAGWVLTYGTATHLYHLPAPHIEAAAATEPILMGFVRVHHSDPHYPIWLWQRKED